MHLCFTDTCAKVPRLLFSLSLSLEDSLPRAEKFFTSHLMLDMLELFKHFRCLELTEELSKVLKGCTLPLKDVMNMKRLCHPSRLGKGKRSNTNEYFDELHKFNAIQL